MPIKSVIWGFYGNKEVIDTLIEENIIEVVDWIAGSGDTRNLKGEDIYKLRFVDSNPDTKFTKLYYDIYEKHFLNFAYMYKRHDRINETNIYDARDIFNLTFNYILKLYIEKKIDLLLMSNIPHEGFDLLFYEIARAIDIKTIVLYQSIIPNYFFCMNDPNKLGNFCESDPDLSEKNNDVDLSRLIKKTPFYMKNIRPYKATLGHAVKYFLMNNSCQKYWKYLRYLKYKKDLNSLVSIYDNRIKYVYFPLHLNPELTTMPLGDTFDDQLLAIEFLSLNLPTGWKIYLKENPKQAEFMRGEYFFRRIKRLKNVVFVPNNTDTFTLIEKSQFVATITGTVGWEAILMGKNALVFGRAWYRKLPGVFEYHEDLDISEITSYEIDPAHLKEEVVTLLNKMGKGVIDPAYIPVVEGYDQLSNTKSIVDVIKRFL